MPVSRRNEAGFSVVEVAIAFAALIVALLGLAAALSSAFNSIQDQKLRLLALDAVEEKLIALKTHDYGELIADYGADSGNTTFHVEGLVALPGAPSLGVITLFTDETAAGGDAASLGLPRDLDGDGSPTNTDVTGSPVLIPVQIRVQWESALGPTEVVVRELLFQEE